MSEEQFKAFLDKVKEHTSLQEKLKAASDADAVVANDKEAGFSIAAGVIQSMAPVELSDDELEGISGRDELKNCDLSSCGICTK